MPEPEFDPGTFAPTFTNPALGLLWYSGDAWTKVGMLAQAAHGADLIHQGFMALEEIRPMFGPLMEVADA